MFTQPSFFGILGLLLSLCSCAQNEGVAPKGNLSGEVAYQNETFPIIGGLIAEKSEQQNLFAFKLTERPIDTTRYDTLTHYVSGTERINVLFTLVATDQIRLKEGTYQVTEKEITDPALPGGLWAHRVRVVRSNGFTGTSTTGTFTIVNSGNITLKGTYPDYTIDLNLKTVAGETAAGQVRGRFITKDTWRKAQ
ncbi:MAG: hypothetical protein AVDCRST_MAG56-790 [uncultured Cytophagales bacterium]|uniref:Uncharacterized protein n=1 Tax=uncultured Cytophagales bacterium TaxID=158755 RepID=A0A6J4HLT1_9SPHI|nr:MAG: hypothetical protein AVDCRST_MAG56-790 [uncultured Cytophagales bacterium]